VIELTVDTSQIKRLAARIRSEEASKQLRKDLIKDIRIAVTPAVSAVKAKLRAIPHESIAHPSPALGSYLAARVRPQVKLSGWSAGVRVRIGQTPNIRGFKLAARRLNSTHWRHKVFGREVWVEQQSPIPGYFDDTLNAGKDQYRAAVYTAIRRFAARLGEPL